MDNIIQKDREKMEKIASSNDDYLVLMINQNRYTEGELSKGKLYLKWRSVNKKIIDQVKGNII